MNFEQMNKYSEEVEFRPTRYRHALFPYFPRGGGFQKPPAKWENIDQLTGFPISPWHIQEINEIRVGKFTGKHNFW